VPVYEVELTRSAEREFGKLPADVKLRFARAIDALADDPFRRRPGVDVRRLQGREAMWRLRVGDHRGIFAVEDARIVFTRFGHRSRVYET